MPCVGQPRLDAVEGGRRARGHTLGDISGHLWASLGIVTAKNKKRTERETKRCRVCVFLFGGWSSFLSFLGILASTTSHPQFGRAATISRRSWKSWSQKYTLRNPSRGSRSIEVGVVCRLACALSPNSAWWRSSISSLGGRVAKMTRSCYGRVPMRLGESSAVVVGWLPRLSA